jgi:hypothetical protein
MLSLEHLICPKLRIELITALNLTPCAACSLKYCCLSVTIKKKTNNEEKEEAEKKITNIGYKCGAIARFSRL